LKEKIHYKREKRAPVRKGGKTPQGGGQLKFIKLRCRGAFKKEGRGKRLKGKKRTEPPWGQRWGNLGFAAKVASPSKGNPPEAWERRDGRGSVSVGKKTARGKKKSIQNKDHPRRSRNH